MRRVGAARAAGNTTIPEGIEVVVESWRTPFLLASASSHSPRFQRNLNEEDRGDVGNQEDRVAGSLS